MFVALHSAPKGFFATGLPMGTDDIMRFVQKAASMGFKAVQIGPLADVAFIGGERLREVLLPWKIIHASNRSAWIFRRTTRR